ncbi:non-histone chromosomal protein HMG-17-like [Callorhinchus milii]|uniref:non-histone chromosomal protein HMG-17-like n=1 Tax=Callorhinchus milii TaxID=7868 RepID=UPI00045760E1|nr:non-histone chromosomal protein HMG-17-like [Callorhinchus milii]|eukprot:gi/632954729/ref/XP_007893115.1/ PREDICTED: non-histone chromosomal protein HMG-17-like [Callorhinchus milii]
MPKKDESKGDSATTLQITLRPRKRKNVPEEKPKPKKAAPKKTVKAKGSKAKKGKEDPETDKESGTPLAENGENKEA